MGRWRVRRRRACGRRVAPRDRRVDLHARRAVVRSAHGGRDEGALHEAHRGRRGEDVVDAPADVLRADSHALAPPGVVPRPRLEAPEGVDPAGLHPAVELGALLGEEAAGLPVLAWAREVDLAVRGVEVAEREHAATCAAQRLQLLHQRAAEGQLVGHAAVVAQSPAALRHVHTGHREPPEVRDQEAPLAVELGEPEPELHAVRRAPREDRHAAVAAPLGRREVRVPAARRPQARRQLLGQRAHLLERDHVRAGAAQPAQEALARAGAQPVHVPGDDAHARGARISGPWTGTCTPAAPARSGAGAAPTPPA